MSIRPTTVRLLSTLFFFAFLWRSLAAETGTRKPTEPLIPAGALIQLMPLIKQARPVGSLRDPFGVVETVGVRLSGPERRTVLEAKLRELLVKSLQSVIHAKESRRSLIMLDGKTFHVGEELFVGPSLSPRPLLEKTRVVIAKIGSDSLELTVHSAEEHHREEIVTLPLDRQFVD
jgi:hypothetical protein